MAQHRPLLRYVIAIGLAGLAAVGFWRSTTSGPEAGAGRIVVENADLERGAALYVERCAACHGPELEGQPGWRTPGPDGVLPAPPHDSSGHTWHHADEVLFRYTKLGGARLLAEQGVSGFKSGMPPFEGVLSDMEIRDVLAFIKTTWSERERSFQREETLR